MKQQPGTPTELFDLSGRVALVTGGSRGLGREMALAFARFGADVIIASRKQDACDAVAEEIRRTTGRRALGRACHVGRWQDLDALADAACQDFGAVDAFERRVKSALALQRGGQPAEIVGAAVYLASGASSFTTGAVIRVDGGA